MSEGRIVIDARSAQGVGWRADAVASLARRLLVTGCVDAVVLDAAHPAPSGWPRGPSPVPDSVAVLTIDDLVADPPATLHVLDVLGGAVPDRVRAGSVRIIAGVYDTRPLHDPRHLRHLRPDALAVLRRADVVLAASDAVAADIMTLRPLAPWDVVVTGTGPVELPPVTGRGDAIVCPVSLTEEDGLAGLLAGYAALAPVLRRRHPLVVATDERAVLVRAARRLDLGSDDVVTVSPDDALGRMAEAALVVAPGHARPVMVEAITAIAAGVAVICPDGAAAARIVTNPGRRFAPNDPVAAQVALEVALSAPAPAGSATAAATAAVGSPPTPSTWADVVQRVLAVYASPSRHRVTQRIAFVTPLPPETSGVALYDRRLAEALARRSHVTCFVPSPTSTDRPTGVTLAPTAALAVRAAGGEFDEVLYALGNHPRHGVELALLRTTPGAVLLHDVRLVGAYAGLHPPGDALADELQRLYPGRYPHDLMRDHELRMAPTVEGDVWMTAEVARLATTVLTHSAYAAALVDSDSGRSAVDVGPLAHPSCGRTPAPSPLGGTGPVIVSAGVVHHSKQADRLVDALASVLAHHGDASLWFVGPVDAGQRAAITRRAGAAGIGGRVVLTGALDADQYVATLARGTVAVQLRDHSNGESSAAVADCLALGLPTIVTGDGALAELPGDVAVSVPRSVTAVELGQVIVDLVDDAARRAALTSAARRFAAVSSFDAAAERVLGALFGAAQGPVAHAATRAS